MEFAEIVETIRQEEASISALFGEGKAVRGHKSPEYAKRLAEAAMFVAEVYAGKRPVRHLAEAMTTSDFPYLFGDILDRQLLAAYRETPVTWSNYLKEGSVTDFRTVNRFYTSGGEAVLTAVPEQSAYPMASVGEGRYQYAVKKYGRRIAFSWEAMINDDLDALKDIPARYGRAARRSEEKFATDLFVSSTGPDGTVYSSGNANIVTSNPVLAVGALQTAFTVLGAMTDTDGEPIAVDGVELVVPPALEVTAFNIVNALQLELAEAGGSSNQKLVAANWLRNRLRVNVNYYIPIIASSSNGNTSWFLFARPTSRPAGEVGFLRGRRDPEIFVKEPNARRIGGASDPMAGDFDTDSVEYKVRHVFGGTILDPKMTVASSGAGA